MLQRIGIVFAVLLVSISAARGDEVVFKNGDKLTGDIASIDGGKMKIKSKMAGDVSVDMKDVASFTTAKPVQMRLNDKTIVRGQVNPSTTAPATTQATSVMVKEQDIPVSDIKRLGTAQKWTGSILANGNLARGNTHSLDIGVAVDAVLRRDDEYNDDRFTVGGAYNFGKQRGSTGTDVTSTDNFFVLGKYDKFFTEKMYGYGVMRADHDRIANLNYRLSPGVGVGYQWFESANFNLSTEAGLSYVYEDYTTGGNSDRVALRLAYHIEKKCNDKVSLFHNLEYLPGIADPGDYNLNADAGIRSKLTENMFSELKMVYQRDNTPAPGALKNDVRFLLGVGWTF